MELGTCSLSLAVKDITASQEFYEKLGFKVLDGGHIHEGFKDTDTMKWRIMQHETIKIGLFQGMFDANILTFNPQDVLSLQEKLKASGVTFTKEASADGKDGFVSAMLQDPDGNAIMLDQMPG